MDDLVHKKISSVMVVVGLGGLAAAAIIVSRVLFEAAGSLPTLLGPKALAALFGVFWGFCIGIAARDMNSGLLWLLSWRFKFQFIRREVEKLKGGKTKRLK